MPSRCGPVMPYLCPPSIFDAMNYWLADGYCRVAAAASLGVKELDVEVRQGDKRHAIEQAFKAKARQMSRRTTADKRRAIRLALEAEPDLSSNLIARRVGVTNKTVDSVRSTLGKSQPDAALASTSSVTRRASPGISSGRPAAGYVRLIGSAWLASGRVGGGDGREPLGRGSVRR